MCKLEIFNYNNSPYETASRNGQILQKEQTVLFSVYDHNMSVSHLLYFQIKNSVVS